MITAPQIVKCRKCGLRAVYNVAMHEYWCVTCLRPVPVSPTIIQARKGTSDDPTPASNR
jgi:DNA-directed RNA polymerase subunit RPC12/RpoP